MDDFYDVDDPECPACGNSVTHSQRCGECDEGYNDAYEDDPINESPGTWLTCGACHGHGLQRWCPKCGADYWQAKAKAIREKQIETCCDDEDCDKCHGNGWFRAKAVSGEK